MNRKSANCNAQYWMSLIKLLISITFGSMSIDICKYGMPELKYWKWLKSKNDITILTPNPKGFYSELACHQIPSSNYLSFFIIVESCSGKDYSLLPLSSPK